MNSNILKSSNRLLLRSRMFKFSFVFSIFNYDIAFLLRFNSSNSGNWSMNRVSVIRLQLASNIRNLGVLLNAPLSVLILFFLIFNSSNCVLNTKKSIFSRLFYPKFKTLNSFKLLKKSIYSIKSILFVNCCFLNLNVVLIYM